MAQLPYEGICLVGRSDQQSHRFLCLMLAHRWRWSVVVILKGSGTWLKKKFSDSESIRNSLGGESGIRTHGTLRYA